MHFYTKTYEKSGKFSKYICKNLLYVFLSWLLCSKLKRIREKHFFVLVKKVHPYFIVFFCKKFLYLHFRFVFSLVLLVILLFTLILLQPTYSDSPACLEKNKYILWLCITGLRFYVHFCNKKSRHSKNRKK